MKTKELFKVCDDTELFLFLKNNYFVPHLTKTNFQHRLNTLKNIKTENSDIFLICLSEEFNNEMYKELVAIYKKDISKISQSDLSLISSSCIPIHEISLEQLFNAEICPLSLETFSPKEICSDIFFQTSVFPCDITEKQSTDAYTLLKNFKSELSGETSEHCKIATPDIDFLIKNRNNKLYSYCASSAL